MRVVVLAIQAAFLKLANKRLAAYCNVIGVAIEGKEEL